MPDDELRKAIRNAMSCDDREHLDSEDFEACYTCQVDKVMHLFQTALAKREAEARIDELDMAISIAGMTFIDGALVKSSGWEGGDPGSISKKALEARRSAIAATLAPPNKEEGT